MRGVAVVVALLGVVVVSAQEERSGVVREVSSRWQTTAHGDAIIVSDVAIETPSGRVVHRTIAGGTIDDLTMRDSHQAGLKKGHRVRLDGDSVESVEEETTQTTTIPISPTWSAAFMPVPYYVNVSSSTQLSPAHIRAVTQQAFDTWTETGSSARAEYAGDTGVAAFANDSHNTVFFRVDMTTSYIARTLAWWRNGVRLGADIMINERYRWLEGDAPCSKALWLEDAATHEAGHFFGLGHSSIKAATMYPTTSYCLPNWRTLDADDIAAILIAY